MRTILRLLMLLLVATGSSFSFAETLYSPMNAESWGVSGNRGYGSAAAACAVLLPETISVNSDSYPDGSAASCMVDYCGINGCAPREGLQVSRTFVCPPDYVRDTEKAANSPEACYKDLPEPSCQDKTGQTFTGNYECGTVSCSGPLVTANGRTSCNPPNTMILDWGLPPSVVTRSGCKATLQFIAAGDPNVSNSLTGTTGGPIACEGTYKYTGEEGTDDTPEGGGGVPLGGVPDGGCGSGSTYGSVNGTSGCYPTSGGTGSGGTGSGGTGSGGTGSGGTGSGGTGSGGTGDGGTGDGGTGDGGTGTGDGTGTGTGGGGGGTGSGTGTASGDCVTPPTSAGDGLQGAILKQIWESSCSQSKVNSDVTDSTNGQVTDAKNDYTAKQGQIDSQLQSKINEFNNLMSSGTGAATCLPDQQITVLNRTVTIPYSQLCTLMALIKLMLLMGCYIFSARVIYTAV